jgi:hypothetical protein
LSRRALWSAIGLVGPQSDQAAPVPVGIAALTATGLRSATVEEAIIASVSQHLSKLNRRVGQSTTRGPATGVPG